MKEQVIGRALLYQSAVFHYEDPGCHVFYNGQVM
jgi:hypothetical protein